jgi:flagellar biosynthesis regulator FlbT
MGVEDIIQKFNYSEDIANYLRKAYPLFVDEFENEEIVYDALMKGEIVLTDNIYNTLKEKGFLDNREDNELVSFETLKVSAGVYDCYIDISYNEDTKEFKIENEKRIVALNTESLIPDYSKSCATHEIGHLIKSVYNENTIDGNTLTVRSGFITRTYQLSYENGKVKKTLLSEKGVGLEEGLNTVLEDNITKKILGQQAYKTAGYQTMKALVQNVMNAYKIPNLWEIFKEAELYHDNTRVDEVLGDVFYELRDFADKLYPLNVKILDMNNSNGEREQIGKKMDELLFAEYTPISQKLKEIGQGSMSF